MTSRSVLTATALALLIAAAPRTAAAQPAPSPADHQTVGVVDNLPVFLDALKARIRHPLSWTSGNYTDFPAWQKLAREKTLGAFLSPPPAAPWNMRVLAEEDRGRYTARKLVFNVSNDSRVLAYMTVPKGSGPFPAVLLLHDHGGRYDIGKEKVLRPFGVTAEKAATADTWIGRFYGNRYLGDVLAERGYVCFVTDALNWSDRAGAGRDGQQALASNLMHLGMSFAGVIAWDDLRTAAFLAQQPEVDPRRIAAMGLSMGGFRTWQLAAMSEHVAAGVSICWITTVKSLMVPGNNQVKGQSSYAFLHPGLLADLDYPDIASIACPKPMLFFNGRQDPLFPQAGVDDAYAKLRAVWKSQNASDQLVTRTWEVPHLFSVEMQDAAFAWLDRTLAKK